MKNLILILTLVSSAQVFAQKYKDNSVPSSHFAMKCLTNKGVVRLKSEILTTRCVGAAKNKSLTEFVIDSDTQRIGPFFEVKTYSSSQGTLISAATSRTGYKNFAFNTTSKSLKPGDTVEGVITMSSLSPFDEDTVGTCTATILKSTQVKKNSQTVSCGE